MTADEARVLYQSLDVAGQTRFLAYMAWELTIQARVAYAAQRDRVDDALALRTANEIQHQILGHLQKLLMRSTDRSPDDVLFKTLLQLAEATGHESYIQGAMETSAARVRQQK